MKRLLKDYFTFNRRERRGIFILLIVIAVELLIIFLTPYFIKKEEVDFTGFENDISRWEAEQSDSAGWPDDVAESAVYESGYLGTSKKNISKQHVSLFHFNPNTVTEEEWEKLGFSRGQVRSLYKFLASGGTFSTKEDLKKMYVIPDSQYKAIEPYIELPSSGETSVSEKKSWPKTELNTADSLILVKIPGIGPWYAHLILGYRKKLGGYLGMHQLREIKKFRTTPLPDSVLAELTVDSTLIKKMNVNACSTDDLRHHPYFGWNLANALVQYRRMHGDFHSLSDIRKIDLVSDSVYAKIAPYLTVDSNK